MRRIVPLVLVALIAFAAGAAGANGTLSRMLSSAGIHVGAASAPTPTATDTPPAGVTIVAAPTSAGAPRSTPVPTSPVVSPASPTPVPSSTATATSAPSSTPTASVVPTPQPALSLDQKAPDGSTVAANGWTGSAGLTLEVIAAPSQANLRAEIEVRPIGQPFSGTATNFGPVNPSTNVAAVAIHGLAAGHYHWQARLTSAGGAGSWTAFAHDTTAFGVQLAAPAAPPVSSTTNPNQNETYASQTAAFSWSAPADASGIKGYSYSLDSDPAATPPATIRTAAQQAQIGGLKTGRYYFHVRAVDGVGNWGPSATYTIHVDVTPPTVTFLSRSGYYINPALESLTLSYSLTKVATVTVGIYNDAGVRIRHIVPKILMPAGVPLKVVWDGRDNAGNLVPAGTYGIWLRATDRLGNSSVYGWGYYNVTSKRIVVSLSQQRLWAYDGNNLFLSTLVTTGNQALPTPLGLYHVMFAKSPFTFISPWPPGSPYYYKPSPVHFALYFKNWGYYIHDAPWRSYFGPGSNTQAGTPGSNTTGTHGCVNVPYPVMKELYPWATPGTAVDIVP